MEHQFEIIATETQRKIFKAVKTLGIGLLKIHQGIVVEELDVPAWRQVSLEGLTVKLGRPYQWPVTHCHAAAGHTACNVLYAGARETATWNVRACSGPRSPASGSWRPNVTRSCDESESLLK